MKRKKLRQELRLGSRCVNRSVRNRSRKIRYHRRKKNPVSKMIPADLLAQKSAGTYLLSESELTDRKGGTSHTNITGSGGKFFFDDDGAVAVPRGHDCCFCDFRNLRSEL